MAERWRYQSQSQSQSQSHVATDGQSVSVSWCRAQLWDFWHVRPLYSFAAFHGTRMFNTEVFVTSIIGVLYFLDTTDWD
jgi:hypothetical protein